MRIRSVTAVSSASLPHVEKEDVADNSEAKEEVFKLVKKLFQATATPKKLMESYDKKKTLANERAKKVKLVEDQINKSNAKLKSEIKSLKDTLNANIKKLSDAINGGIINED